MLTLEEDENLVFISFFVDPVAQASKLAHRDLAKEFKQKDPTEEKPKPI